MGRSMWLRSGEFKLITRLRELDYGGFLVGEVEGRCRRWIEMMAVKEGTPAWEKLRAAGVLRGSVDAGDILSERIRQKFAGK